MTRYGIGHTDTINSLWYVVDAFTRHPSFKIKYLDNHDEQQAVAQGFYKVSSTGFKCCAGAEDGILIWIHNPSSRDCMHTGCISSEFFCGRRRSLD
jgi:hypothetical protein